MMATVPHVTSGLGLRKFQADGFLLTRVYNGFFVSTFQRRRYVRLEGDRIWLRSMLSDTAGKTSSKEILQ